MSFHINPKTGESEHRADDAVVILPARRYTKTRGNDHSYSEYAEGWDACLEQVTDALEKNGIAWMAGQ